MSAVAVKSGAHIGINGQLLSAARTYRSAGVSGYIRQLLTHLPAAAPDLELTAFIPDVDLTGIDGLMLRRSRRWNTQQPLRRILWEQCMLPVLSWRAGLDLLHATVNVSSWATGCPAVVTVHDLSFMRYPQAFPRLQRLYLRTQARRSVRTASRVIAVSEATKQDIIAHWQVPAERIDVVYNGVDEGFHPRPAAEVADFRRRKGLPERYILHLGTLEPRKNLVRLVRAFHQVQRQAEGGAGLKLVLAGGQGWDYQTVLQEVARLGLERDVIFSGYVPDEELAWWYCGAAVFAYPSLMEGFGLPVAEAMACGVPVVTSAVSSLPEVAGDAALLVDPTSVDTLAHALLSLLTDPDLHNDLSERGRRRAAQFSWQSTARDTARIYRQVLSGAANLITPALHGSDRASNGGGIS